MQETHSLWFAPFRLDLGAEQLWRGEEARPLTRKAFATLRYLVAHAGKLVTKDELIAAVWDVPYVSDMALATCIREIRRALDEQAHAPQFVETVRGRGYRFLAAVTAEALPEAELGTERAALADVSIPSVTVPHSLVAERRHLTVLLAEVVHSTVLASQMDPEEWQGMLQGYYATCAEVMALEEGLYRAVPERWGAGLLWLSAGA